jgi:MarR family transcriptional regulator for hemolysin
MTGSPPDIDLSFLLNQTSYALAAQLGGALADLGISVREYCVLWKAAESERTQIEIAELAALDKTTMVVTLDALEKSGLARREVSGTDRRARVVAVTDAGHKVLDQAFGRVAQVYDEALADLSPRARDSFVKSLQTLASGVLASPSHTAPQRRRQVKAQPRAS